MDTQSSAMEMEELMDEDEFYEDEDGNEDDVDEDLAQQVRYSKAIDIGQTSFRFQVKMNYCSWASPSRLSPLFSDTEPET